MAENEGRKDDLNKVRLELLPWDALEEVGRILTYGAEKYGPNQWRGVAQERYIGALLRHLSAYQRGETYDPESGQLHLAHLATNALFILAQCVEEVTPPKPKAAIYDILIPQGSDAPLKIPGYASLESAEYIASRYHGARVVRREE